MESSAKMLDFPGHLEKQEQMPEKPRYAWQNSWIRRSCLLLVLFSTVGFLVYAIGVYLPKKELTDTQSDFGSNVFLVTFDVNQLELNQLTHDDYHTLTQQLSEKLRLAGMKIRKVLPLSTATDEDLMEMSNSSEYQKNLETNETKNLLTVETEVDNSSNSNEFIYHTNTTVLIDNISIPMPVKHDPSKNIQLKFRSVRAAVTVATCFDNVRNGLENGVDCGPSCPLKCTSESCSLDIECKSGLCSQYRACQEATCTDGVQNQGELGIDCGGPCTKRCNGQSCGTSSDCWSGVCGSNKTCLTPTCSDNVRNGLENGVDCGPSCPLKCTSESCSLDIECKSGLCSQYRACQEATCTDGAQNQGELGIDCGGPCTKRCNGQSCGTSSDCWSGVCGSNKICISK